jgi:heme/copper-type cytochrome/quinol oxidase subunit 3
MWVFLATDTMGFGGLLLAYGLLRVRAAAWPDPAMRFDRPLAAALTFILLGSGATISAAVAAARRGQLRAARVLLIVTVLAGLAFVAGQALEFQALAGGRHVGLTGDHAAALFYVIAGYHGLHVLVGIAVLVGVALKIEPAARDAAASRMPPASPADDAADDRSGAVGMLEVASLYWQFVDLVWIVIFTALYLLPPVTRG